MNETRNLLRFGPAFGLAKIIKKIKKAWSGSQECVEGEVNKGFWGRQGTVSNGSHNLSCSRSHKKWGLQ